MGYEDFRAALQLVTESARSFSSTEGQPEAATRDQLLNPLLEALGYGPHERTLEGAVPSLTATTAWVDYLLRRERGGRPWLMIEAKAFGDRDLWRRHRSQILTYIRDYAIMIGTDQPVEWIVLTNVREWWFVRLGEREPFWGTTLEALADEGTSRRLYSVLAREHVANERLLELFHERRRDDVHERTTQFLADLKTWRVILANGLRLEDPTLPLEVVKAASHRLLLRFLLVRVLEAHGNEPYFRLGRELQHWRTNPRLNVMRHLKLYFEGAWEVYNTELLSLTPLDDLDLPGAYLESIVAQDATPPEALRRVLGPLDTGYRSLYNYDFSTLEHDVLGTAYEQFLAHELTEAGDGLVSIVENAETRKREGVFYTPGYVVDEIVRKVVAPLVAPKIETALDHLRANRVDEAYAAAASVLKVRVVDPACGSGSFLIRVHGFIVEHLRRYDDAVQAHMRGRRNGPTTAASLFDDTESALADARAIGALPERVMIGCIFGVDLDDAAVELARLALWTQLLRFEPGRYGRPGASRASLPSLALNVRNGNSLIDPNIGDIAEIDRTALADAARAARDPFSEPAVRAERVAVFEARLYEMRAGLDATLGDVFDEPHSERPFAWALEFADLFDPMDGEDEHGFNAAIGNPPYYNVDATFGAGAPMLRWLEKRFPEIHTDKTDILFYFFARGVELLRCGGTLGFIVSRSFLQASKAEKLRRHLAARTRLDSVLDFLGGRVFGAGIATAVVAATRTEPGIDHELEVTYATDFVYARERLQRGETLGDAGRVVRVAQRELHGPRWGLSPYRDTVFRGIDRHRSVEDQGVVVGQGMQTGANEVFVVDRTRVERLELALDGPYLRPLATNRNIGAYHVRPLDEYVIWVEDAPFDALPAVLQRYLEDHREALERRAAFRRGDCEWFRFTWPLHADLVGRPKLMHSYRAGRNGFVVDEQGVWLGLTNTTHVFPGDSVDPHALAVLLNSPVAEFRHRTLGGIGKATSTGMYEYFANQIEQWPVPAVDGEEEVRLGALGRAAHDGHSAVFDRHRSLERVFASVPSTEVALADFADPAGPYRHVVEVVGHHPSDVGVLYRVTADVIGDTLVVDGEVGADDESDRVVQRVFELRCPDDDLFELIVHRVVGACRLDDGLARRQRLTPGRTPGNVFQAALQAFTIPEFGDGDVPRNVAIVGTLIGRLPGGGPRLTALLARLRDVRREAVDAAYGAYGVEDDRDEIEAALALVT